MLILRKTSEERERRESLKYTREETTGGSWSYTCIGGTLITELDNLSLVERKK